MAATRKPLSKPQMNLADLARRVSLSKPLTQRFHLAESAELMWYYQTNDHSRQAMILIA